MEIISFCIHILIAFPTLLFGITTTHHDKPEQSQVFKMAATMVNGRDSSRTVERHKRLLPYINYYVNKPKSPSNRINKIQTVPISENNIPAGSYVSFPTNGPYRDEIVPVEGNTDFLNIYETLVHLKQAQKKLPPNIFLGERPVPVYRKVVNSINRYYEEPPLINTYTPKNIDIPYINQEYVKYREYPYKQQFQTETATRKPDQELNNGNSIYFRNQIKNKPISVTSTAVPDEYENHLLYQLDEPSDTITQSFHPTTNPSIVVPESKTSNVLSKILKQLQNSNTLPQTFTTDNIDYSIKTLVKILNSLRKQQSLKIQPIVVSDDEELENYDENDSPQIDSGPETPRISTQYFPANTIDGGTPGRPGIDYPALSTIPQTKFNCKTQRYKGFFGDPQTNCQVWHYCDLNGGQASFLCPNGTIFSQVALTCDWWYNVKCANTAQQYVLNERLYKYIIPLAPKFPEDYSGPVVDKYLALKFQEMEEKMKKEKKEEPVEDEKDEADQLQDINKQSQSIEET